MKKGLIFFVLLGLVGCSYFEDPGSLIRDPHFAAYEKKLSNLESSYLRKEISYAEYLDKKQKIDETYAKEVQQRESEKVISSE